MKVRGQRECRDCGTRWSYYDTGSVACPDCGSLRSVGVDEQRKRHTDAAVELDIERFRTAALDGDPVEEPDELRSVLRAYVRRRGFIRGGDLLRLDDTYLAARELLQAVDVYERERDPDEAMDVYVLALLRGAPEGKRPPVAEVPDAATAARGLAYANALDEYRDEVATYLDDHPDAEARRTLGSLRDHVKRTLALQGDVPPGESEAMVNVARDLHEYVVDGDEAALARARERLSTLEGA